ncbi:MAG: methyltransferase [Succinivibrio sp.]
MTKKTISAFEAISKAQEIACGPMLFQTVCVLFDHNVLNLLDKSKDGLSLDELENQTDLNRYALDILLDMAISGCVVKKDDNRYYLTKIGYFICNDNMTRINLKFNQHVCYKAMTLLDNAVTSGKPSGLKVFDESWETIYPHLSELPGEARKAWFDWDHLYSQTSFREAIRIIGERFSPQQIFDVGGNTGKFAIECSNILKDCKVTIIDLPQQIKLATENIKAHRLEDRLSFFGADILEDQSLPEGADIWWMSQFLDCFSEDQVVSILSKIRKVIKDGAHVCILEPIADRQKFDAASFSINAGSLYFCAIANGYSRFYSTKILTSLIEKAGFKVDSIVDNLGISNSMFICSKA